MRATGTPSASAAAKTAGTRSLLGASGRVDAPVYVLEDQPANAGGEGPAIVEGPFFTARVPEGWQFQVSDAGDLILSDRG